MTYADHHIGRLVASRASVTSLSTPSRMPSLSLRSSKALTWPAALSASTMLPPVLTTVAVAVSAVAVAVVASATVEAVVAVAVAVASATVVDAAVVAVAVVASVTAVDVAEAVVVSRVRRLSSRYGHQAGSQQPCLKRQRRRTRRSPCKANGRT